jgi:hypothetical protein
VGQTGQPGNLAGSAALGVGLEDERIALSEPSSLLGSSSAQLLAVSGIISEVLRRTPHEPGSSTGSLEGRFWTHTPERTTAARNAAGGDVERSAGRRPVSPRRSAWTSDVDTGCQGSALRSSHWSPAEPLQPEQIGVDLSASGLFGAELLVGELVLPAQLGKSALKLRASSKRGEVGADRLA